MAKPNCSLSSVIRRISERICDSQSYQMIRWLLGIQRVSTFSALMPDGSRPGISLVPREHCPAYSSISVMGSTADRILVASPRALCAMDSDGNLAFVAGDSSPADGALRIADGEPAGKAALGNLVALAVAPDGTVAFLERETNRIRKVAPTPEIQ